MTRIVLCTIALWVSAAGLSAQEDTVEVAKATDLIIPSAPAFVLLGVNPAKVAQPGFVEDFKLDLLVRDDRLAPDIAVSARPIWIFAYDKMNLTAYRSRPALERMLSTLGISLGTATAEEQQRLALAGHMNLFRRDPLLDTAYTASISRVLRVSERQERVGQQRFNLAIERRRRISEIRSRALPAAVEADSIAAVEAEYASRVRQVEAQMQAIETMLTDSLHRIIADYQEKHWNAPAVDVSVGQLLTYTGEALDSLRFESEQVAGWISAASGFGTTAWLFSGLARSLDFGGNEWEWGVNARYGGSEFNFFVEFLSGLGDLRRREVAYGGEFRFDNDRKVEFAIRTEYSDDFHLRRLVPVIRGDLTLGDLPSLLRPSR